MTQYLHVIYELFHQSLDKFLMATELDVICDFGHRRHNLQVQRSQFYKTLNSASYIRDGSIYQPTSWLQNFVCFGKDCTLQGQKWLTGFDEAVGNIGEEPY